MREKLVYILVVARIDECNLLSEERQKQRED